ncbi:MAG: alpha/beta hydrolase [Synechocystis sp.]
MLNRQHLLNLGLALGVTLGGPQCPVAAAEKVIFSLDPLGDFDVHVDSLITFAKTGTITPDLKFYTQHLKPDELAQFRTLLQQSFTVNAVEMFDFFNTSFGQEVVQQLSTLIDAPPAESQPFLKAALILAAENPKGVTIMDVIKNYDSANLVLNTKTFKNTLDEADTLYQATDRIFTWLDQRRQRPGTTTNDSPADLATLAQPGQQTWTAQTLTIPRPNHEEPLKAFVYLPNAAPQPAPLVVISPGLNSNFAAFRYLADHLASYGFAIVGINFPESDAERMGDALKGLDTFPSPNAWMNQPKDISLVLDTLAAKEKTDRQWQGKFTVNNTGILGHSLGGYTATASGGAKVQWPHVLKECATLQQPHQINLNPALLWQCQGINSTPPLPDLQDPRVKAFIAINPVTNPAFGAGGINEIAVPMMFVAGSDDIFAPSLPEQIEPFASLDKTDKYLLLVKNSTHLSFVQGTEDLPQAIVGDGQTLAYDYMRGISLAFFNRYLHQQSQFEAYLTDRAVEKMSQDPLPMHMIRSLTPAELQEATQIND